MKTIIAITLIGLMCIMTGMAYAQPDSIYSNEIREADGTSGQNTNAGSGIKTGHIQNGAVTSVEIRDGAVTSVDIQNGAVTSVDIQNGAVTSVKIQNGAVNDEKITGPISGSKINFTGLNLNADTLDGIHSTGFASSAHNHDTEYQKKYANVAVLQSC